MSQLDLPDENIQQHNLDQRQYFERRVKKTMVPIETPYLRRHVEELLAFADYQSGQRVLEIGCGMGRHTLIMARLGVRVEGLDLSPVLLERLKQYSAGQYDIPVHCADILYPPEHLVGGFDLVVGTFTLHHLYDIAGSYQGMVKFLKPGGRILFLEPNPLNVSFHFQIWITPGMSYRGERRLLDMRQSVIFKAMQQAGLSNLRLKRFGFFPPFLANRPWGARLESLLERFPLFQPILPFQLFSGDLL